MIQSYMTAIDDKNKDKIKYLYTENNKNSTENNIVYELYNKNELNSERLLFIIENCTAYLKISSSLIKKINE